jgi:hypothetical protein
VQPKSLKNWINTRKRQTFPCDSRITRDAFSFKTDPKPTSVRQVSTVNTFRYLAWKARARLRDSPRHREAAATCGRHAADTHRPSPSSAAPPHHPCRGRLPPRSCILVGGTVVRRTAISTSRPSSSAAPPYPRRGPCPPLHLRYQIHALFLDSRLLVHHGYQIHALFFTPVLFVR